MKTLALLAATVLVPFATLLPPVIQVRDDATAPTVTIVGWDVANPEYGLRTRLRRDGTHQGDSRVGEHRLFLSSVYVEANGPFALAVAHTNKLLRTIGTSRDIDACRFGNVCTPSQTIGIGVSDAFLREHRDSLIVTLRPQTGRHWTIRLEGSLINAYLGVMDSVSASLKK